MHTLSHAVRINFCGHMCAASGEMAAGQTTCVLELGGSGPWRGTGAMWCAPVRNAWIPCWQDTAEPTWQRHSRSILQGQSSCFERWKWLWWLAQWWLVTTPLERRLSLNTWYTLDQVSYRGARGYLSSVFLKKLNLLLWFTIHILKCINRPYLIQHESPGS